MNLKYLSVFHSDEEILKALSEIHLKGDWYDLDCTYSIGNFYKNIQQPKYKSDLFPQFDDVTELNSNNISSKFQDLRSIVFDPPFLFRKRNSINNDKISSRFTCFNSNEELLEMYETSLMDFNKALTNGGYVFVKCQDMTDNKFYCTHQRVIEFAEKHNFELKDIAIKLGKSKLQKDAVQQNCVAKIHSYWLVFKKKKAAQASVNEIM